MWFAEALQRQGWAVTKHDTEVEAQVAAELSRRRNLGTVNPVREARVVERERTHRLPRPPSKTYDESWS